MNNFYENERIAEHRVGELRMASERHQAVRMAALQQNSSKPMGSSSRAHDSLPRKVSLIALLRGALSAVR